MALACARCDRALVNVFGDVINQPSDGLSFQSEGHYGSTKFDPMAGGRIYVEINICDKCLVDLSHKGQILEGHLPARAPDIKTPWVLE